MSINIYQTWSKLKLLVEIYFKVRVKPAAGEFKIHMTLDHSGHMSSSSSHKGQGKFPASGLRLSRVRREVDLYPSQRGWVTSVCLHSGVHLQLTGHCSFHYTCLLWSRRKCPDWASWERRLSEPVCQVTATPVSSHFLRDVSEIRGTVSPHSNTCMYAGACHWNNYRLLQRLTESISELCTGFNLVFRWNTFHTSLS